MLKGEIKNLPVLPGVYLVKNQEGMVIYIGKAKRPRNRVSSYFRQNKQHSKEASRMVHCITDFDFVVVDVESDASLSRC